jgi:hypothetical protein
MQASANDMIRIDITPATRRTGSLHTFSLSFLESAGTKPNDGKRTAVAPPLSSGK